MRKADKTLAEAERLLGGWQDEKSVEFRFPTAAERQKGFQLLLPLAESGHAKAELKIGECLIQGHGVSKDSALGAKWLKRAAEQGLDEAECALGQYYLHLYESWEDRRVSNLRLAHKWMKKAADQGYFWALLNNAVEKCTLEYQQQAEADFKGALAAAQAGDALAQRALWMKYMSGCGVKRDEQKARFWLQKYQAQEDDFLRELKRRADAGDDEAGIQHVLLSAKSALDDPKNFLPEGEDNSGWLEKEKQKKKRSSARGKRRKSK